MLTVVADTNIYIFALAFGGMPERFIRLAEARAFRLATSDALQKEMAKVLRSEKFQWPEIEIEKAQQQIARFTQYVETGETLHVITADPSDNRIPECALAAQADAIVNGDKQLLQLQNFGNTPVIKVAEFLQSMRAGKEAGAD